MQFPANPGWGLRCNALIACRKTAGLSCSGQPSRAMSAEGGRATPNALSVSIASLGAGEERFIPKNVWLL